MSGEQPGHSQAAESGEAEPDWLRRRRLDAAFGDVLPEGRREDRDPDRPDDGDAWLLSQVPPHH